AVVEMHEHAVAAQDAAPAQSPGQPARAIVELRVADRHRRPVERLEHQPRVPAARPRLRREQPPEVEAVEWMQRDGRVPGHDRSAPSAACSGAGSKTGSAPPSKRWKASVTRWPMRSASRSQLTMLV